MCYKPFKNFYDHNEGYYRLADTKIYQLMDLTANEKNILDLKKRISYLKGTVNTQEKQTCCKDHVSFIQKNRGNKSYVFIAQTFFSNDK